MYTKHFNKLTMLLLSVAVLSILYSCKAKVNFNDIDTRMQAEMGLGVPVGSMLVTANDFLGGGQVSKIMVDEQGIFHYIDTLDIPTRNYHKINLSDYLGKTDKVFTVKEQLQRMGYLDPSGKVTQIGQPINLEFPLTLQLTGINENPDDERIDSVQITNASLKSLVNVTDLGLQWAWIESIDVKLNDQFRRPAGQVVNIYTQGQGYGYADTIPVDLRDQFTVSLMKDKSLDPGADNVLKTCDFTFLFKFTIPQGAPDVYITDQSAFNYHFETKFIDFDAAWGFFQSSKDMRDRDQISIDSIWDDWKNIKKLKVRLMEPRVTVKGWHHVAAPLMVYIDTVMVSNSTEKMWGTWYGQTSTEVILPEVMSPYTPLGDSVTHYYTFNQDADKGHIDQLFNIRPDSLYYSFRLMVDPNPHPNYPWKQHRVTNNTELKAEAEMDIPFKVNKESEAEYITQFNDIDFKKVNIDSLLKTVDVLEEAQANHIKLYMLWVNTLPFAVDAKVWFLRPDSSIMNLSIFEGLSENVVHLPAPKMERKAGETYGYVSEPSTATIIMDMTQEQFDSLAQCKHLKMDAYMGENMEPSVIDTTTSLTVRVGVAANVEAIINLEKKSKK